MISGCRCGRIRLTTQTVDRIHSVAASLASGKAQRGSIAARLCDRGATQPEAKIAATLQAKGPLAWGFVARSSQIHGGYAPRSRLAPGQNPSLQSVFYPTVWVVTGQIASRVCRYLTRAYRLTGLSARVSGSSANATAKVFERFARALRRVAADVSPAIEPGVSPGGAAP